MICPYNENHIIPKARFNKHLKKCKGVKIMNKIMKKSFEEAYKKISNQN